MRRLPRNSIRFQCTRDDDKARARVRIYMKRIYKLFNKNVPRITDKKQTYPHGTSHL